MSAKSLSPVLPHAGQGQLQSVLAIPRWTTFGRKEGLSTCGLERDFDHIQLIILSHHFSHHLRKRSEINASHMQ